MNVNVPKMRAIKNVSPPDHLPTYRKVPKKTKNASSVLGINFRMIELLCYIFGI